MPAQSSTVSHIQVLPHTHTLPCACTPSCPPDPHAHPCSRTYTLQGACNLTTHAHHTVTPRLALKITRAVTLVRRFSWCFHCTDHVDRVGVQPERRHQGRPPALVSKTRDKDNHPTSSLTTTRAPSATRPPLSASFCWSFSRIPRAMTATTTVARLPAPAPPATTATAMTSRQHPRHPPLVLNIHSRLTLAL